MSVRLSPQNIRSIPFVEARSGKLVVILTSNVDWFSPGEIWAVGEHEAVDLTTENHIGRSSEDDATCRYLTAEDRVEIEED